MRPVPHGGFHRFGWRAAAGSPSATSSPRWCCHHGRVGWVFFQSSGGIQWAIPTNLSQNVPVGTSVNIKLAPASYMQV